MSSVFATVVGWCDRIHNGRGLRTAFDSVVDEVEELREEVTALEAKNAAGPDGVFGEAVDVLCSIIDIIRMERPDLTAEELEQEVAAYADRKCDKWARKYS